MASQLFEPFAFDNPTDWFTRMDASHSLLETSSGKTIGKKTYFLATVGSKGSTLLAHLLAPLSLEDASVDYALMKTTLLNHLKSQHLEIAERSNFYSAHQAPNETSSDFFSRLKKISEFCNFGASLDSMLRDRLVLGCRSLEARKRLLQKDPLTLKDVQETLAVFEAIDIAKTGVLANTGEINYSKQQRNFKKSQHSSHDNSSSKSSHPKPNRVCYRCGKSSCKIPTSCPALGKTCSTCGKQNHYSSVCRSKSKRSINYTDDSNLMYVDAVPTNHAVSRLPVSLNGCKFVMEVDTGAAATLISSSMWRSMGSPALMVSNRLFSAYDGHRMKPVGELRCTISTSDASVEATVTVVESTKQYGLLGRDILDNFIAKPVVINNTEVAALPAMKIQPVSIDVADHSKLRFCKARPIPLPMIQKVNEELSRLQEKGIIKPVSSSSCASPVVWVRKRDGTLRMCADFKVHVNECLQSDSYPLPAIETIFAGMSHAKVFATLDLKEAYWQVPLDANSRKLCTINTSKGLFELTRLPKGMKNSASIFQRVIESVLEGIPDVVVYQDDILVHATTPDQLAKRLSTIFRRFEEKGVTVNQSKSVLNATEVKFLGHLISSRGIVPDPGIAQKIASFKPPTNRSELESFLGLINFFGRMISRFSETIQPLHQLRRKDVEFSWKKEHQDAFDKVLQALASPPVLKSYDLHKPVTLTTDASEKAIGGVLTQEGHPVMFVSRVLTKTEQRYSNVEREGLAVVWSTLRLKQLLLGRHFYLVTDHKPLVPIYGGRQLPKVASNRLIRWSILLQRFNFTILYKAGSEISHADALTRLNLTSDTSEDEDFVINNCDSNVSEEFLDFIRQLTTSDSLSQKIMKRIQNSNWKNISPAERPFFRVRDQLEFDNGVIWFRQLCYIPFEGRKDVFESSHQEHTGIHSTISRIKLSAWWPTVATDVRQWIQNCPSCAKIRPITSKKLSSWPTHDVFQRLHADWCYIPDVGNILVVVDSASGWIECSLPMLRTTHNVIDTLSTIFCRFGVPKVLVTDNAAEFTSNELNEFCRKNGISKMESPPYHPQSNGVAERGVQTVKNGLKAWKLDTSHMSFKDFLKRLLLHHRACFRRPDGRTPGEVVYGRAMRVLLVRGT